MFIVNVEGAIHCYGKWLLILRSEKEEHAGGLLSLVGGKCEIEGVSSDVLERTLQREIFEEVGCEVSEIQYINSASFVTDSGLHVIDIVFYVSTNQENPTQKAWMKLMKSFGWPLLRYWNILKFPLI